ncbi:hypothetical protein RXV95_05950 [Novosphingobium sp. ZN18A2]|uniref:hypothetical protein n=1 Tax=Novosphingobium sp. ZN18A2 TaxID=3079861 RepID=UPI0030D11922
MKRPVLLACLALGIAAPLAACHDGYRSHITLGWSTYPYYGWYDGYYGTIYDGYWGVDNFFYYRLTPQERYFRRGDSQHFRRDATRPPDQRFRRFEGTLRPPPQGTRMPEFRPPGDRRDPRDRRGN